MKRAKLVISYDGSRFAGFSKQKQGANTTTVVNTIEKHLVSCGIFSKVMGAGRTDAGVHATAQCIAFDLPDYWDDASKLELELKRKLPSSIAIKSCEIVSCDFHPRFGAKSRAYRYIIATKQATPFESSYLHFEPDFDFDRVQKGVQLLNGTHDFVFFKKSGGSEGTTMRHMRAVCYKYKDFFVLRFESSSFLRAQIRLIVNFLLEISRGSLTCEQLSEQLACHVQHSMRPAPASGLYLVKVSY